MDYELRPKVLEFIAHRGVPRLARENTLPSFDLALQAGADGIELDVHVSADAVVVVHHDARIEALGADIAHLSRAELAREGIPTLHEVCDFVRERATLYVEAKAPQSAVPIIECLTAHQVRVAVHSFDARVIRVVRDLAPTIPLGLLVDNPVEDVAELVTSHAVRDYWPQHKLIDVRHVLRAHEAGCRLIAWTVNETSDALRLREIGVDALCSDDVGALRRALAR